MLKNFLLAAALFLPVHAEDPVKVGPLTFNPAEPWVQGPTGGMITGALSHGKSGPLLKFYFFGEGQGGGVKANLQRWQGQFQGEPQAKTETKKYGAQKVTVVTVTGTFLDGPPMADAADKTARENFTLLGAIIASEKGDVFLKMTGPTKDVEAAREDFTALLASAFPAR